MRRIISVALLAISFVTPAFAQVATPIPEQRLVYSKDIDFYGADLTNLFDTTLDHKMLEAELGKHRGLIGAVIKKARSSRPLLDSRMLVAEFIMLWGCVLIPFV